MPTCRLFTRARARCCDCWLIVVVVLLFSIVIVGHSADLLRNEQNTGWLFESVTLVPFTTVPPPQTTPRSGRKTKKPSSTPTTPRAEKQRHKERSSGEGGPAPATVGSLGSGDDAYLLKGRREQLQASEGEAKEAEDHRRSPRS
jgi:hypothetical protein